MVAELKYKNSRYNDIAEVFIYATIIINLVIIARFFKAIYMQIFEYLLTINLIVAVS